MHQKYLRNNATISGRLKDELVMMDIEKGKYFSLNPEATRIWELLEKPLSVEELCVLLRQEFAVDPGRCAMEVTALLEEMMQLDLVLEAKRPGKDPWFTI